MKREPTIPIHCLLAGIALAGVSSTNRPSYWAQTIKMDGVPNLHQVSTNLYRSAQPSERGMQNLKQERIDVESISLFTRNCKFRDCTHVHEEGCALLEAVEPGNIDTERYRNYLKLNKEAEFFEMSYIEKCKKDKAFGKMIKNYKKMKRKNN